MTGDPMTVGGRYELGDPLGRGGMAEVRYAVDTRLGRPVAVKQLRTDLATDPTFQARFRREAQSAAGLNHPTIVAVYDTGEETDSRTGVSIPYIVMELVEGQTLRDVLRDGRKILPERALELSQGVLDALSYSHKAGIIHRDIKPANVMLTPTGGVKVMDFGIARAVADTSATMTQTAAVIGTAQYLSPEQARGETVDARSDIYSAGCLLYELLVGRPPFVGDSPVSVAYQHVREMAVPPSQHDPMISADIDAITLKALAKDPDDRYQSAREMKADITRVLAGEQATAVVPRVAEHDQATRVVAAIPVVPAEPEPQPPSEQRPEPAQGLAQDHEPEQDQPRKKRVGLILFVVGLALCLVGGGAYGVWRLTRPSAPLAVEMVGVPSVIGLRKAGASSTLRNAGLVPTFTNVNGRAGDTVGTATKQSPVGDQQAEANSSVAVEINVGPEMETIPDDLVGQDSDDATKTLEDLDFTVSEEPATNEGTDTTEDEVLAVNPGEGDSVTKGSEVVLSVASGKSTVPDFLGASRAGAERLATDAGFKAPDIKEKESDDPAGTVITQNVKAGQSVARSTKIKLTVAIPKPEPVPEAEPSPSPSPTPTPTASPSPTPTKSPSASGSPEPSTTPEPSTSTSTKETPGG